MRTLIRTCHCTWDRLLLNSGRRHFLYYFTLRNFSESVGYILAEHNRVTSDPDHISVQDRVLFTKEISFIRRICDHGDPAIV